MLPQLQNLVNVDDDVTDDKYGHYPDRRPIPDLLQYGMILVDKPAGPTSHEVVAWVKRILEIEKAGHSGTLDPGATGLLPLGLGEGTKALGVLLIGPKEYYALARLHTHVPAERVRKVMKEFTGEIYQRPPQRSSVKRVTRVRTVYEFDYIEDYDRLVLMRVLCQAGTYIRKIIYDVGEVLSPGATMVELRRTQVSNLYEKDGLVRLHDLSDAYQRFKEAGDEDKLRRLVLPIEKCLEGIRGVTVRDTAVDALCHGAPLAVPGVIAVPSDLRAGELVGVYTLKGEIIGLGEAAMTREQIEENAKGVAFVMKRLIMKPDTYSKAWRSRGEQAVAPQAAASEVDLGKLESDDDF
ncbi:RNA-guided pseudouridylation complex pseudouridine synthase subunit Cbf5 [Nitrososphaera sp.]|uniref:RNA-guided pseudouridylation complex pseudouridine synthase subunit Cbf5 n=1 Tax=Nitrososphaera sp. TaxID=1971748 RepID=UPI0017BA5897|nr:RNA-guided pseudouridylation complex pseudouridine synthase subunit Cbf5 [Nitrososphaera sp.]NWG37774.1 RNA-guided pseudouridylation complex pseudouridine synthase subunit Cbf5 [Nitrososphaera sp.]